MLKEVNDFTKSPGAREEASVKLNIIWTHVVWADIKSWEVQLRYRIATASKTKKKTHLTNRYPSTTNLDSTSSHDETNISISNGPLARIFVRNVESFTISRVAFTCYAQSWYSESRLIQHVTIDKVSVSKMCSIKWSTW